MVGASGSQTLLVVQQLLIYLERILRGNQEPEFFHQPFTHQCLAQT